MNRTAMPATGDRDYPWARNALDDGFEYVGHAFTGFGADQQSVRCIQSNRTFDHFFGAGNIGAGQINLVNDGNDFEAMIDREIANWPASGPRLPATRQPPASRLRTPPATSKLHKKNPRGPAYQSN